MSLNSDSSEYDIDPESVVWVRDYTRHGTARKFHTDADCQHLDRVDDVREMKYGEFCEIFKGGIELCKSCDPEFEVRRDENSWGKKSVLERAMDRGDVPDEFREVEF